VRGFKVTHSLEPSGKKLREDFSPFIRYTPKGDSAFFSWVPEEAGEFQKILTLTDPDAGQVPCLDPKQKTDVRVARGVISRVKRDFSSIRSWRSYLSGDAPITKPQWAEGRFEKAGRAIRDLYMVSRSIQGNAKGYVLLHDLWEGGTSSLVKLTQYPLAAVATGFLRLTEDVEVLSAPEARRIFLEAAGGKALPNAQDVAKFLAVIVGARNLSWGLLTYLEQTLPVPLPKIRGPGGTSFHWSELSEQALSGYIPRAFRKAEPFQEGNLKDAVKVIADLAVKYPEEKLTPEAASSLFWYYALYLTTPDLGGPLSRRENGQKSLGEKFEDEVLPILITVAGGSTIGQASTGEGRWRAYKTYNPLVFKVTQEYFRDPGKWANWAHHPEISREAELIGYYGMLLRIIQMAEVLLVNEGNPPRDWNDLSLGLISLLQENTAYGPRINPIWNNISPSWYGAEQKALTLEAFLGDPQSYVKAVKKQALPGFVKVGSLRPTALEKTETEYSDFYDALLRLIQMAEKMLTREGTPSQNWEDLTGGLRELLGKKPRTWTVTVPLHWDANHPQQGKDAFLANPQGFMESIKKLAGTGLKKSDEKVQPFRSGTSHGEQGYPEDSVASQMTERENTRVVLLSALNKYIDTLR